MGIEWISSRYRGLSWAMALHVTKSVGRPLRFSAFLSARPSPLGTQSAVGAPPNRRVAVAAPDSWACVRRGQPNVGLGCGSSCLDPRYPNRSYGFTHSRSCHRPHTDGSVVGSKTKLFFFLRQGAMEVQFLYRQRLFRGLILHGQGWVTAAYKPPAYFKLAGQRLWRSSRTLQTELLVLG